MDKDLIHKYFETHHQVFQTIDLTQIEKAIKIIKSTINDGRNIFTMGNGGSAHTASHYITDWNKMSNSNKQIKVNAHCLNENVGMLTALSNDINYESIFSEQLSMLMKKDDLILVISGSGNSKNIIEAIKYANNNNGKTMAFLGYDGGEAIKIAFHSVLVPSFDMQVCEDIHLKLGHIIMKSICGIDIVS